MDDVKIPCPICVLNLIAESVEAMKETVHDHMGMHRDNGEYL